MYRLGMRLSFGLALLMSAAHVGAQSSPPVIFFTDIQSGPKTGGEGNNGVYVTIYGNNFGATRGSSTVTVGGGAVSSYPVWGQSHLWFQKITVQLGSNASTGNLVVTTSAGSSNPIPFTVRSGNIYFVATNGNDSNNGSITAPFRTIVKCKNQLAAGDTCYVRNGVTATATDNYSAAVVLSTQCSATSPCALLTYPGESATIGTTSMNRGVYACSGLSSCSNAVYWIVGGFSIRAQELALYNVTGHHKWVANEIQCPPVSGASSGCIHSAASAGDITVWGNEVSNVGTSSGSQSQKLYHGIYLSGIGDNFDVGWNKVHNVYGCRGIQTTADSEQPSFVHIHHNLVYDVRCDGINVSTSNATQDGILVDNNVVYNTGTGPDPGSGANYTCIYTGGTSSSAHPIRVFNNTLVDCGARGGSDAGMIDVGSPTLLKNNIFRAVGSEVYFSPSTNKSNVLGSNNLWFGQGSGPTQTTANINADPLFVDLAGRNFNLLANSPAKDAGTTIASFSFDISGARQMGTAPDVGALEYFQGGSAPAANQCDVNGDLVVTSADATLIVQQILAGTCSIDLDSNGKCDVVDLQRVINAGLNGGTCKVGP